MATNYEALLYTLTEFADVFNDFFNGDPTDVTFKYMDQNGKVQTKQVPNVAKVKTELAKVAVSDDDLTNKLKAYYSKVDVDAIKTQIEKMFDNYYSKSEVNDLIRVNKNVVEKTVSANTALINSTKAELSTDIDNKVTKAKIMTKAEYTALKEERNGRFAGSGVLMGRPSQYEDGSDNFGNFHPHFSARKYWLVYHGKEFSLRNSIALGDDERQRFKPIFNVNGHRIVLSSTGPSTGSIKLPEAPTAKAIVKNDKKLPVDLKQGDFIVLKDINREFVNNGTFDKGIDGWALANTSDYHGKQEYDSTNKRIKITVDKDARLVRTAAPIYLIKGVRYKLTFSIQDKTNSAEVEFKIGSNPGDREVFWNRYLGNGNVETEFISDRSGKLYITLEVDGSNASAYYDNISVKQVEEQPVVALENTSANDDIYAIANSFRGRSTISRKDFVFLETWEEDIAEKDVFYPYGNIQYHSGNINGIDGLVEANWFDGHETYSRFGTWQEPNTMVGKGYRWSKLTEEQRRILASDPDNNVFLDGDRWIQVRYRFRVAKGTGDDWSGVKNVLTHKHSERKWMSYEYNSYTGLFAKGKYTKLTCDIDNDRRIAGVTGRTGEVAYFYNGVSAENCIPNMKGVGHSCTFHTTAVPLAIIQRRNDGVFNKLFNTAGAARGYDKSGSKLLDFSEYAVDNSYIKSLEDCFNVSKIAATTSDNNIVPADDSAAKYRSGYVMSGISGNELGTFVDIVDKTDVQDIRMAADKVNPDEILADDKNVLLNNFVGKENPMALDAVYTCNTSRIINGGGHYLFVDKNSFKFMYRNKQTRGIIDPSHNSWVNCLLAKPNRGRVILEHPDVGMESFNTFYAGNYYIGVDYVEDASRLDKFAHKDNVKVYLFSNVFTSQTYNQYAIATEVIGDPRKLQNRTSLNITSTNSKVGVINHNEYVYCGDGTHNKGQKGSYYRLLKGPLTSINTNDDSDGTANTNNGYIDFSDSTVWLNLGSKSNLGGYPDSWLENGFQGYPLLIDEFDVNMLPINGTHKTGWNSHNLRGIYYDGKHLGFRLSRPIEGIRKVAIRTKDGSFNSYQPRDWTKSYGSETGNSNWSNSPSNSTNNAFLINLDNTYSALGYASVEEMLDLMVLVVSYEVDADRLKTIGCTSSPFHNSVLSARTDIQLLKAHGQSMVEEMIGKVPEGKYSDTSRLVMNNAHIEHFEDNRLSSTSHCDNPNSYLIRHTPISFNDFGWDTYKCAVKFLPFVTANNGALYLNYMYKELKFNSNPDTDINPGIYSKDKALGSTKCIADSHRSYSVAYFEDTGALIGSKNFDVYGDGDDEYNGSKANSGKQAFIDYIKSIPTGSIVAISTYDEPSGNVKGDADSVAALKSVGASEDILNNLEYRSSYALIGIKTGQPEGTKLAEDYRGQGEEGVRVEYAVSENTTIIANSLGNNSKSTFKNVASWGDDNAFNPTCNDYYYVKNDNGEKVRIGQKTIKLPFYGN